MTSSLAHVEDNVVEAFFVVQELCEKFHDFALSKNPRDEFSSATILLVKYCARYDCARHWFRIVLQADFGARISSLANGFIA
jgi:hypothetical protein